MAKRIGMPQAKQGVRPQVKWELTPQALEHWTPNLMAAAAADDSSISILDPIGLDPWTGEGVTAKRIGGALRAIGAKKDVTVNINSPGGDLFEGLAIYSLLREHEGNVNVRILGIAASAASIIAMAGDTVQISRAGFLMIHDVWVMAIGNRNDLRSVADQLEPFDLSMADIYSARSGIEPKKILKMMDAEAYIRGQDAVDQGFADSLLSSDQVTENASARTDVIAAHLLDVALAKAGMPRSERRSLLKDYKAGITQIANAAPGSAPGTQIAAGDDTQIAVDRKVVDALSALRSFSLN